MTQPQEVTIDQMIEYCERCMADSPFYNESRDPNQAIQEAIIGTLRAFREVSRPVNITERKNLFLFGGEQVIQSGVKYPVGDAVPNTQAECEDAIGKFIQERFTLEEQLLKLRAQASSEVEDVGLKSTIGAVEYKVTMIKGRLFYLKSQVKFILQNRLSHIDAQLESHMIDHVEEADLKGLRVRIVEKIGVIDNELKAL